MTVKKTILVNFVDMYIGFDKKHNQIIDILSRYYNIELSDRPDFLFYSGFGTEHLHYDNCVKIFLNGENVLPDFNQCDYGQGFDFIDFGDRYFRRYYYSPDRTICDRSAITPDLVNRRFCNFIYSNSMCGDGAKLRQEFCKKLMEYRHVDCPGRVLNNMSDSELAPRNGSNWQTSKSEFLKKYKFTIAFENTSAPGYTTEKLFQPILAFSIPIYWGNPDVVRDFNPRAFINCNDYNNDWDAIIARVRELDNDPDQYLAMLRENPVQPDFDFDNQANFERWLLDIIARGNSPFCRDPLCFSDGARLKPALSKLKRLESECTLRAQLCKFVFHRRETTNNVRVYICGVRVYKYKKVK